MCEPIVSTCKHVSFSIPAYNLCSKTGGNPEHCKTKGAKDCKNFKRLTLDISVYKVHFSDLLPFFLISPTTFFFLLI